MSKLEVRICDPCPGIVETKEECTHKKEEQRCRAWLVDTHPTKGQEEKKE